jgi:hypothetical protein
MLLLMSIVFDWRRNLIQESPGHHAQVASYNMMSLLTNEKISSNQKYPYLI